MYIGFLSFIEKSQQHYVEPVNFELYAISFEIICVDKLSLLKVPYCLRYHNSTLDLPSTDQSANLDETLYGQPPSLNTPQTCVSLSKLSTYHT